MNYHLLIMVFDPFSTANNTILTFFHFDDEQSREEKIINFMFLFRLTDIKRRDQRDTNRKSQLIALY